MIVPVRCFTCGRLVGDRYEEFTSRMRKGEDPSIALDSMGFKRYCCRRMLISNMDVIDQLMPYEQALWERYKELNFEPLH